MEVIRMLFAFDSHMEFKLFHKDIKNGFLNGYLMEEVHVKQPLYFKIFEFHDHVYKLDKVLYGLKQASKLGMTDYPLFFGAWIHKRETNNTLFIRREGVKLLIVQIYA